MEIRLPKERILRTYKRYSLPITPEPVVEVKKLEFFYIGSQSSHIEKLKDFFEYGYTTISPDHAIITLKRLLKKAEGVTVPDMIIAEAGIGTEKLKALHQFISEHKVLADMPFIVEASGRSRQQVVALKELGFVDEVIFLSELAAADLLRKGKFLKRVKQQYTQQPKAYKIETSFPMFPDASSFVKRTLDLMISSTALLFLSPLMALIALAIRLEANGPVLVQSRRVGRGYKLFHLFKFRTETSRTGAIISRIGLDDLPQLVNVLIGDLSLVGVRPLLPREAARLTTDEWAKRFMSPAGMTGVWQFRKNDKEQVQLEEGVELYDLWGTPSAMMQETNG